MAARKSLPVGFSEDERAVVDAAAASAGLRTSTWVRRQALAAAGHRVERRPRVPAKPRRGLLRRIGL